MPHHVPSDEMLSDYARGATTEGVALLMAAHMTHVPGTRARVQCLEEVGGELLASEPAAEMSETALSDTLALLDRPAPRRTRSSAARGPIPAPIAERMGVGFDEIPWKFQLPGVWGYDLPGFKDEKVSLLRARPGAKVPQHTHEGVEMTLVLQGVLSDGGETYLPGDIAVNTEDDEHRPQILGDQDCYCLIVRQGNLRFTGPLTRLLNYLGE